MELSVSERVHIVPVGHEYDRVVKPATDYRADLVILIGHERNDEQGQECWQNVIEGLTDANIEFQEKRCDIFNLYDSLATITEIMAEHGNDDVYVNVSSGSKITAIAGMIASMVMDSRAYYVQAEEYSSRPDTLEDIENISREELEELARGPFIPKGIAKATELPKYPIDAPEKDQVTVMEFIQQWSETHGPPTKGEIIYFANHANLKFIKRDVEEKGRYRLLDTYILDPLKERDWVDITKQGRSKVVSLSENGEAALSAFRWMDGDEIEEIIKTIEENREE